MRKSKSKYRDLQISPTYRYGEYLHEKYPSLKRFSARALEEPFFRMVGLREKASSSTLPRMKRTTTRLKPLKEKKKHGIHFVEIEEAKSNRNSVVEKAFIAFKTDSASLQAEQRLIVLFQAIESINDHDERKKIAKEYAEKLENFANKVIFAKEEVSRMISKMLSKPSVFRDAIVELIKRRIDAEKAEAVAASRLAQGKKDARPTEAPKKPAVFQPPGQPIKSTESQSQSVQQSPNHRDTFISRIEGFVQQDPELARMSGLHMVFSNGKFQGVRSAASLERQSRKKKFRDYMSDAFFASTLIVMLGSAVCVTKRFFFDSPNTTATIEDARVPLNPYQKAIAPDDDSIRRTASRAVKTKGMFFNELQIFDLFDHVARNIEYLNVSEGGVPKSPAKTIEDSSGDCKSMAVLLASMIESIGGKTTLTHLTIPGGKGHLYVGVVISENPDKMKRDWDKFSIIEAIQKRYKKQLASLNRKLSIDEFSKLAFREVVIDSKVKTVLLLDPTTGIYGLPGIVAFGEFADTDSEKHFESRPGHSGLLPNILR